LQGPGLLQAHGVFYCISKTPNGSEKYGKTWKYHQNNLLETRFYLFRDGDLCGYSSLLWQVEAVSFMNPPSTIGCLGRFIDFIFRSSGFMLHFDEDLSRARKHSEA
jgi:hypothetical protein